MELLAPLWLSLRLALLLAGLLVPGAALLHALRLPRSIGTSFAASSVILFGSALALDLLGLRLSLTSLATMLAAGTIAAFAISRRTEPAPGNDDGEPGPLAPFTSLGGLTVIMLLYWAVIGFLLFREPLAGPDIQFRWAFLPAQWLRHGNLDFYPPVSAGDFLSYFWPESIPPGVASLHAWAFACGGSFDPAWTIPVTALQFLALHDLAWRVGAAAGGNAAARPAALLVAACPLLNWSCRLGQETGLTALAALGLALTLLRWRATARPAWAAAAGLFAALGAMTREYGLLFPALAVVTLLAARAPRATWRAFALAALPLALVWPLRCAVRTGNPFYSLDVAALLPINRVFADWLADLHAIFGAVLTERGGWIYVVKWFALGAAPALVGWIAFIALSRRHRPAALGALAAAAFLGLWVVSVRYTGGGLFYSLRVASPAIALGAVAAGVVLARVPWPALRTFVPGVFLIATLPLTLLLPQNPLKISWHDWPVPWRSAPAPGPQGAEQIVPAILAQHTSVVLTDSPGFQTLLAPHGLQAIPFWSPQAAWLFDPKTPPAEAARRWRASGLQLVVLSKFAPAIDFLNRRARWDAATFRFRVVGETPEFMVLRVEAPAS